MLKVEMLSTGDEVLHGQIVDTNAAWLADFFFHQGLPLTRRNTVGDNLDDLVTILRERSQHADVLIVNGGLGPTSDDLSALAAATAKGEGLVLHEAWLKEMERYFHERGRVMAPSNRKQAELPASAEFINNPVGTACGFAVQLNRCLMFFTPGVPSEFKVMVEHEILPRSRRRAFHKRRCPAAPARAFFFTAAAGLSAFDYIWSFGKRSGTKPGHPATAAGRNNGLSLFYADYRTETHRTGKRETGDGKTVAGR